MSRLRIAADTDDRMQDGARSARTKASIRAGLLSAALLVPMSVVAVESADDVRLPVGYRNWFHVNSMLVDKTSPQFEVLGGMHSTYVNPTGEAALKKGGPYPNRTILVDDVHDFTVAEGSYTEGPSKVVGVMTKDKKRYAATGGWGFQAFAGGDRTKPLVTDATKQCFECHQSRKDQDYVFSTYIP